MQRVLKSAELRRAGSALITRYGLFSMGALLLAYAISDHPFYGGAPGFGATQSLISLVGIVLLGCGFLPADTAGRLLVLACMSLIMLGIGELAGELVFATRFRSIYQNDDEVIFNFVPGRESVMKHSPINGGHTVRHRINNDGYRGPDLTDDPALPRVAIYGDSFIHASYSAWDETYVAQFGYELQSQFGIEAEIINAGVSSYGPDQIAIKMASELPTLRPDLVIVALYAGNDYGDLMRNKLFLLSEDGSLIDNDWRLSENQIIRFDLSQRTSILKRVASSIAENLIASRDTGGSRAIDLNWLLQNSENEYNNYILERNSTITNTHVDYYNANISLAPDRPSTRYEISLMRAVIQRIRDVAEENRSSLALLLIPHASDVAVQYDDWIIDAGTYPEYDSRNQIGPLETIAQDLGIPVISLYDSFRARDANTLYLHDGDDHWNLQGQALAAAISVELLGDMGILDALTANTN